MVDELRRAPWAFLSSCDSETERHGTGRQSPLDMSRQTTRARSSGGSGDKRKNSDGDICVSAEKQYQPATKSKKVVLDEEKVVPKDNGEETVSPSEIPLKPDGSQEAQMSKKTKEAVPRNGFIEAKRRAVAARRKLDVSIRHQQNVMNCKKSMTRLKKELCSHLRRINSRLVSCQDSNKRLEEEVRELRMALFHQTNEQDTPSAPVSKQVKTPHHHAVLVSVPDHLEERIHLHNLKDEAEEVEDSNKQSTSDYEEALIVDQRGGEHPVSSQNTVGKFTFITLNTEEDYPGGSWLGDDLNSQMRVRCHIPPPDMLHIMNMYKTPEKLALKLLDLLVDKDTQATSNLSGTGKHKKKKLDPLVVYGIHCHLVKHFNINNEDWYRIRLNIDSKCRTAFRRKQKGLELYPKHMKRVKRLPGTRAGTAFTTQDFQHSTTVQHIQQVVNQLQSFPGEGITIIQEQPDGSSTVGEAPATLVGHTILHHEGGDLQADQLKEVISQAANASEIHLSTGQTIAISQSGEVEIREVHVEEEKE